MESRALLLSAMLVGSLLSANIVHAQTRDNSRFTSQFLPAGRELKIRLGNVTEAVKEERFAEAAEVVGEFFLDEELEDYFVDNSGKSSLKGDALKLLLSLPTAGRESYELQFGADARMLLNTAIEEQSDAGLGEVMRKYLHTKAGNQAALLWSRRQLDAGRPLAAAVMLDRIAKTSLYAQDYEPELSFLMAVSWRLAGHSESAQQALLQLKSVHGQKPITIAGAKLTLFTNDTQALAWLDTLIGEQTIVPQNVASQWMMHRGNPARNASTNGSAPVPTVRWHKFLGRDDTDDQILARKAKDFQSSAVAAIPTVWPLVINDTVLMRTPERLMAVNLNTGKFVWRYPWDDVVDSDATSRGARAPTADAQHEKELLQRVWEDRAYGQLSSDGESVFLLDDLGYTGMGYSPAMIIRPGGARQPNPGQPASHNKLVALSLNTQGKLRWTVGGATGEDEPKLAGAFFLGVPLVYDGSLYAAVEVNGELRLVVLDPATGKVEWSQQLAHIENVGQQILSDSMRRLSGAAPSLASGILICPTSASSVVAIDLTQRKLLWGHQYEPSATIRQQSNWAGYMQQQVRPVGSHWHDSTATIADGKVVLTPIDSDYLICLDLVTGKEAWKPLKRTEGLSDLLYVACVDEGKIILVGRNRVTAINLRDGQPAWSDVVTLTGELPSGRGFQSGHEYYLPTTKSQLLKIDLRTGKVVQRTATGRVLGNLVPHGTQLISQQFDGVASFYQSESLRTLLVDRLKTNPEDPEALAQLAQLQLFDDKRDEALATLRKAYGLDRTNDDTRSLLVRTLLEALERDFDSYQALAAEIEPLLDQPQHKRDFLRLKAQGLQKAGDTVAAFEAYATLAGTEILERPDSSATQHMVAFDPQVRVRFDRWVNTRLHDLYTSADANTQAKMDDALFNQWKLLPQTPTIDQYTRIVQFLGWHSLADDARVELATLRLEAGDALGAEVLLSKFALQGESQVAGRAVAVLAAAYDKVGRTEYAADCYVRLRDHFSEVKVRGEKTGSELFAAAAKSMTVGPRLAQGSWATGAVEMNEGGDAVSPSVGYGAVQRLYPMPIAESRGVLNDGSALILSRQQVILRDRLGAEWSQASIARPDGSAMTTTQPATTHAHLLGHLAIVSIGHELLGLNLLQRGQDATEAQLWRTNLIPSGTDNTGGLRAVRPQTVPFGWTTPRTFATLQSDSMIGSVACLSDRAVCFMRARDVVCVDPLTGETLWERTLEAGCELFGDEEMLFAIPPRKEEAVVLSVADGRELGKRQVGAVDFRWSTHGRNVLVCKQDGREFAARLYDAWSEKTLWEGRFAFGSRGTLIGRDEMAMFQPNGKFDIMSLVDGKVLLDTKLEPEPRLMYIHVLRSKSQYFLQLETIVDQKDLLPRTTVQPLPGGETSKLVTGRLYAFDRATMKPSWPSPAYISQYGLPLDQPMELPLLVFLRQTVPSADAPSREPRSSVLVLDRRDGRIVLERDSIRIPQANVYQAVGNLVEQSITLSLMTGRGASGKIFTFKLTDKPTPPAPPAQTGAMSSLNSSGSSGNIFQAIGRAIGEGTRPETPDDFLPRQLAPGAPLPPGFPPGLVPR